MKIILVGLGLTVVLLVGISTYITTLYDYNSLKPQLSQAVLQSTGHELTIQGDISFSPGLNPTLSMEGATLSNADWSNENYMARIEKFELKVSILPLLRREIHIQRLILEKPHLLIEINEQGRSNLEFSPGSSKDLPVPEGMARDQRISLPGIAADQIQVKDAVLEIKNHQQGKNSIYNISRIESRKTTRNRYLLLLEMDIDDESLIVEGVIGCPISALASQDPLNFQLRAEIAGTEISSQGSILDLPGLSGLRLQAGAKGSNLSRISHFIKTETPLSGPFSAVFELESDEADAYSIRDFNLTLDKSSAYGTAFLDLRGERPVIEAAINMNRLDLRPALKAQIQAGSSVSSGRKSNRLFSSEPLPLEGLKKVDTRINLAVDNLSLPWLDLDELVMDIVLKDGRLDIDVLNAARGQGSMVASLFMDTSHAEPVIRLNSGLSGWDLASTLQDLGKEYFLEARLEWDINIKSRGGSIAAIMANLDGVVQAGLGPSVLENNSFERLGADLSSNLFRIFNPDEDRGSFSAINCGVLVLQSREGLAELSALVVDTTRMTVRGSGTINLRNEALDITLSPRPKEGLDTGVFGRISLSLSELARSFKISGTLADPKLALDPKRSLVTIGKGVGGTVLFGPIGAAASLLGSSESGMVCLENLENGSKEPETYRKGIGGALDSMGEGLRRLFR